MIQRPEARTEGHTPHPIAGGMGGGVCPCAPLSAPQDYCCNSPSGLGLPEGNTLAHGFALQSIVCYTSRGKSRGERSGLLPIS